MDNIKKAVSVMAGALLFAWTGAVAVEQQEGLVIVNVSDNEILEELNLDADVSVQAPISVAANVCGINANVIAEQSQDDPNWSCEAQNSSPALAALVTEQNVGDTSS